MGGALPEAELVDLIARVGLVDGRRVAWHDTYTGTAAKDKVSGDLNLGGATFFARKP